MSHALVRSKCRPNTGQRFTVNGVQYVLRGKLGQGAVGLVRKGLNVSTGEEIAVKFLAPDPKCIDPKMFADVAKRFKREGERGPNLQHQQLLRILAYSDNTKGSAFPKGLPSNPFVLMEFVRGSTLESYIKGTAKAKKGAFTIDRPRLCMAIQLADALEYLRKKRLVHRDVKPANVFLTKSNGRGRWNVKLGDFGIMKWGDFHSSLVTGTLTTTGQHGLGTMKYMSPEQATRPKTVTSRSDTYSLGVTLFELFTSQILATAHHVYEVREARQRRGNTLSRFQALGISLKMDDGEIAGLVLDMFRAPDGRPPIDKICSRLEWEYERRFKSTWESDLA